MICRGDIVKYKGCDPIIRGQGIVINEDNDTKVTVKFDNGLLYKIYRRNLIKLNESEDNNMAKLEGYYAVAVIKQGYYNKSYYYGIYNDGYVYKKGDKVVVSGGCSEAYYTIDEILTIDEAKRFRGTITAEIICKIDTSAYDKRVEERNKVEKRKKEAAKIKKQMDKIIAEMGQTKRYEMYASDNPELAEKLKAYKELLGEK